MNLGVGLAKFRSGRLLVDAGRGQQRGYEIDMGGEGVVDLAAPGCLRPDPGDGEGNPGGFVVQVEPLLVEPAVGPQQLAVVGRPHQDGVF